MRKRVSLQVDGVCVRSILVKSSPFGSTELALRCCTMTFTSDCVKLSREVRHQYSDVPGCQGFLETDVVSAAGMQLVVQLLWANAADDVASA